MVNIKSTSDAIWWIKNPKGAELKESGRGRAGGRKKSRDASFCLDMADLVRNISLQGYSKLLAPELTLCERLIWLLVHTTMFGILLAVLSLTWEQFAAQYFVINLKDPLYPVENVPFPAVSICSNNRISKQAVTKYALELQRNDPSRRSLDYYLEHLKNFRDYYMTGQERTIDMESNTNFQTLLDLFGTWENETFYDTRRIMKMLAPECKHLILKCSLANVNIPCFSKLAFQESLNPWGPCCTFNTKNSLKKRHFKNRLASSELGLTVVLNSSQDDYFTPVLNTNGYIVIVHDSENYASVASSNAVEVHPGQNEESFLMIYARVVETDPSLDSFSAMNRRCYFDNEAPNPEQLLASIYTFPNCITRCRIRSMVALCRCLPFYMPWRLVENQDGVVYCTLNHIPCLRQYNFKWTNVLIERKAVPGLEREMEEALYCPQCLPSCNDVQYSVSLHSLPIDNYLVTFANKSESNSDISLLRVYFGDPYAHLYIRLLNNAWFEVFSTIGNILSIIIGFSLVAIFETLFVLLRYIFESCARLLEQNENSEKVKKAKKGLDPEKLYICP